MLSAYINRQCKTQALNKKYVWFALAFVIIVCDQLTKHWAVANLNYGESLDFLPHFNFTLLYNYGAAFSLLADAGGWQRIFFTVIALAISLFLVCWILRVSTEKKMELVGLSLVLGGAIGNLWDRIALGYVVDFIDWFYIASNSECLPLFYSIFSTQSCHWPAFNIADSSVLIGAGCLIVDMFINDQK